MKKLKLSKFELDRMPEAEIVAMRAGSGSIVCHSGLMASTYSDSNDVDVNNSGDSDDD